MSECDGKSCSGGCEKGGRVEEAGRLPDGSGFAVASFPLPKDHWLHTEGRNIPPMPFRLGTKDPRRLEYAQQIRAAAKYAVRCATMNGKEMDFDPDALVQQMVVGMLGLFTPDGLDSDPEWNPSPVPPEAINCACCEFDDGSRLQLVGFAGGGHPEGAFSNVTCHHRRADGTVEIIYYKRAESREAA